MMDPTLLNERERDALRKFYSIWHVGGLIQRALYSHDYKIFGIIRP